jgi:hypothetical protein
MGREFMSDTKRNVDLEEFIQAFLEDLKSYQLYVQKEIGLRNVTYPPEGMTFAAWYEDWSVWRSDLDLDNESEEEEDDDGISFEEDPNTDN